MAPWFVVWLLLTTAALVAIVTDPAAATRWRSRLGDTISRSYRRLRPPKPVPIGPPIEVIAADLRRLQVWLDTYADPQPLPGKATRLAAASMAYDRVLTDACHALEIPESLEQTSGFEREAERLRLQLALAGRGLVLTPSRRTG